MVRTMADYVSSLAPWEDFWTPTFAKARSCHVAARLFEKFMSEQFHQVSYFYAVERNPGEWGHHVHAVIVDLPVKRRVAFQLWFERHGRNRLVPIVEKSERLWVPTGEGQGYWEEVSDHAGKLMCYVSKYVVKKDVWWNCHLTPMRKALREGPCNLVLS